MPGQGFRPRQRRGRFVARRQNHAVRFDPLSVREPDDGRIPRLFDVHGLAVDEIRPERNQVARPLQMVLHDGAQVVPVHHARDEPLAQLDLRHLVELGARPQPLEEVIRLIGEGGHVPRRDVEQVLRTPHAVGDAPSGGPAMVDHRHLDRVPAQAGQVCRGHDAAEAAADDGDAIGW